MVRSCDVEAGRLGQRPVGGVAEDLVGLQRGRTGQRRRRRGRRRGGGGEVGRGLHLGGLEPVPRRPSVGPCAVGGWLDPAGRRAEGARWCSRPAGPGPSARPAPVPTRRRPRPCWGSPSADCRDRISRVADGADHGQRTAPTATGPPHRCLGARCRRPAERDGARNAAASSRRTGASADGADATVQAGSPPQTSTHVGHRDGEFTVGPASRRAHARGTRARRAGTASSGLSGPTDDRPGPLATRSAGSRTRPPAPDRPCRRCPPGSVGRPSGSGDRPASGLAPRTGTVSGRGVAVGREIAEGSHEGCSRGRAAIGTCLRPTALSGETTTFCAYVSLTRTYARADPPNVDHGPGKSPGSCLKISFGCSDNKRADRCHVATTEMDCR